ncbi:phytoene desaturase [Mollisia scopiformis]|uniref:Phytoene desaturase n=1 Tax=Mollisia scopiformis TaxID=149040 RepID=A0A194X3H6_MOLSC|nr:phytoene desaturase [Mollisia scopiformis]KUJ14377.1 phytoene desaturase [Mollisia scopiformis]
MASKQKKRTAIIVGAGVGGLATAARLSKAGFSVTILEKNGFTGGRCSLLYSDSQTYRFDTGPSLLLLPKLFKETFHDLDTSLEAEGVQLLKCEPNYNIWFGDGESFVLSTDMAVMKREIEKWEGKAGFERWLQWLGEAHRHYEVSVTEVLHKNFYSVVNLLRPSFLRRLFELHPFESIYSRAARYFWTERLRRVFTFGSMYMGMSPFDAPGTYSLLQYTELAEGIWYPVGGFHAVCRALAGICERQGVDIRLSTPVKEVLTTEDGKTVTGVLLENGEVLESDLVVINADLVYAYSNLFPPKASSTSTKLQKYSKSLQKRPGSCSSISFYWSLSQKVPELTTHNIFLADQYRESFDSIFDRQSIPEEPSFYVNVPSRIDPTAAPDGKDAIVVLVPVGHLLNSLTSSGHGVSPEQDWDNIVSSTRTKILTTIQSRTSCAALSSLITHEQIHTPLSWESTFNLDKGSILGLSHSFFNVLAFRPKIRAKGVKGVYFVGASTHPGTGVPIVLAGAKITVEEILKDLTLPVPWGGKVAVERDEGVVQGKGTGELDRVRRGGAILSDLGIFVLALVVLGLSLGYMGSGLVVKWDPELKPRWGSGRVVGSGVRIGEF